ncbi:DnaJ-domain-containing protein [Panus rudis PR-1116 ss-1]|nr:DnaJ-domain-containing protein [Panus rudis PR-1116 ss-1]
MPNIDYYASLSIPQTASLVEIKQAYRRALLLHHPDKLTANKGERSYTLCSDERDPIDIGKLKEAYETLSNPILRASYDIALFRSQDSKHASGPRPAQVISLEDFTEIDLPNAGEEPVGEGAMTWAYECRCGGRYVIDESMMERDEHLVGCNSCSEVVWVGYEVAEG